MHVAQQAPIEYSGHKYGVTSLVVGSGLVLTGSEDRSARVWKEDAPGLCTTCLGHEHWVTTVAADWPEGVVYTGSMDKSIRAWSITDGSCLCVYSGHADWVTCLLLLDGVLVSGAEDGSVFTWRSARAAPPTADGGGGQVAAVKGHAAGVRTLLSLDHGTALSVGADGVVRGWKIPTLTQCLSIRAHVGSRIGAVSAVIRHGATPLLATGGIDGHVKCWELPSGHCVREMVKHTDAITCLDLVSDTLLSGSDDGDVRAWDPSTGHMLQCLSSDDGPVSALAGTEEGLVFVGQLSLHVWNVHNGARLATIGWSRVGVLAVSSHYVFAAFEGLVRRLDTSDWKLNATKTKEKPRPPVIVEAPQSGRTPKGRFAPTFFSRGKSSKSLQEEAAAAAPATRASASLDAKT